MTNSMGWTCRTDVSYSKPSLMGHVPRAFKSTDGVNRSELVLGLAWISRLREPSMLSTEITVKRSVAFDD